MIEAAQHYRSVALAYCKTGFRLSLVIFALLFILNAALVPFASSFEEVNAHAAFFISQFNFDDEGNFATWMSSGLLIMAAIGCIALSVVRSLSHPYVSWLLLIMGFGFLLLSMDDVSEFHGYAEELIAGTVVAEDEVPDPAAVDVEDKLGPVLNSILAVVFITVFFRSLARTAQRGNVRYLLCSGLCVAMASVSELVYDKTACDEDWCYQLYSLFEESFEFGAIFFFLAFLIKEIFQTQADGTSVMHKSDDVGD